MESIANPMPSVSILLVEDDEATLKLLATIFARKFPDVALYPASNGRMGLELFKEHAPDIVVTDINMPVMNGVQMVGKIKAIKPATKIIVLSADSETATLEHDLGKVLKIDHFIMKPIDFTVLFAAIGQCIGDCVA